MRKMDLERNELIYNLYFKDKLTVSEISQKASLSISQISRILSKSSLYQQEKSNRKEKNHKKHNEQTKEIMRKKRNKKQMEEKAIMDALHKQASIELSYFSSISTVALRKNYSSSYNYNNKKKRFELKDNIAYSNDMPKIIKY